MAAKITTKCRTCSIRGPSSQMGHACLGSSLSHLTPLRLNVNQKVASHLATKPCGSFSILSLVSVDCPVRLGCVQRLFEKRTSRGSPVRILFFTWSVQFLECVEVSLYCRWDWMISLDALSVCNLRYEPDIFSIFVIRAELRALDSSG